MMIALFGRKRIENLHVGCVTLALEKRAHQPHTSIRPLYTLPFTRPQPMRDGRGGHHRTGLALPRTGKQVDGALDRPPGAAPRSGRGFSPGQSNVGPLVLGCVVPRALRPVGPVLYRCWVLASFSYLWRFGYSWSVSPSFTLPQYTIIERIRIYTCALARAARAVRSSEHTCARGVLLSG